MPFPLLLTQNRYPKALDLRIRHLNDGNFLFSLFSACSTICASDIVYYIWVPWNQWPILLALCFLLHFAPFSRHLVLRVLDCTTHKVASFKSGCNARMTRRVTSPSFTALVRFPFSFALKELISAAADQWWRRRHQTGLSKFQSCPSATSTVMLFTPTN